MKVKDEAEWQLFCAEIAADSDARAQPFHDFVVAWAEAAETLIENEKAMTAPGFGPPIHWLRKSLRPTEEDQGRWTVGYLGMALVVLGTHWEPAGDPKEFFTSMSTIEQNLFTDVAQVKLQELAKAAAVPRDD